MVSHFIILTRTNQEPCPKGIWHPEQMANINYVLTSTYMGDQWMVNGSWSKNQWKSAISHWVTTITIDARHMMDIE